MSPDNKWTEGVLAVDKGQMRNGVKGTAFVVFYEGVSAKDCTFNKKWGAWECTKTLNETCWKPSEWKKEHLMKDLPAKGECVEIFLEL